MKIFSSINSKITESGDFNKDDLTNEATNICSTMKDNPLFSQLMGLQSSMFGQMQPQTQQPLPNSQTRNISVGKNKESDRNSEARKKAKSKLEKRNKEKVKVNKSN